MNIDWVKCFEKEQWCNDMLPRKQWHNGTLESREESCVGAVVCYGSRGCKRQWPNAGGGRG